MAALEDFSRAIESVGEKVGSSVVRIGGSWRSGSGVVIGPGAVLTNAHNVRSDEQTVVFADGREAQATLVGVDVDGDLAVLKVDTGSATALEWAGTTAGLGAAVFAVTVTGGGPRVTLGFVSGVARAFRGPRGRRISGSIEHTAPLAPGSSGSALVNADGELVGLNTNRLGNGFYLALPADESLKARIASLQRGEKVERPRLGIGIAPSWIANRMRSAVGLAEREGVLVREVEEDSPAARAGLTEGDLIVEIGGKAISQPDDVYDALGTVGAGQSLTLRIVRGADERTVEVNFAAQGDQGSNGPVH